MKANACLALAVVVFVPFAAGMTTAAIEPVTSVKAGKNGSPPYILQSVTVRDYTVTREFLATGISTGSALLGTSIRKADDFDLNSVATRNHSGIWRVTQIGGKATWHDTNGDEPDFFIFEAGMNDALSLQAILPGGVLGKAVSVPETTWGKTGLARIGLLNIGQPIGGIAFAITDLLDSSGMPLGSKTVIEGIQINSGDVDPVSFLAVVPEPATLAILGLGILVLRYRRS